jgi:hypothetical protein
MAIETATAITFRTIVSLFATLVHRVKAAASSNSPSMKS